MEKMFILKKAQCLLPLWCRRPSFGVFRHPLVLPVILFADVWSPWITGCCRRSSGSGTLSRYRCCCFGYLGRWRRSFSNIYSNKSEPRISSASSNPSSFYDSPSIVGRSFNWLDGLRFLATEDVPTLPLISAHTTPMLAPIRSSN